MSKHDEMIRFLRGITYSIEELEAKSDKDIEIKISFEAIEADTGEFVAYGPPVWIKIPKDE